MNAHDLPDEAIESSLADPTLAGPRNFRGRALGKYSLNVAGLVAKVLGMMGACQVADAMDELHQFPQMKPLIEPRLMEHDFLFLEILADAYVEKEEQRMATYRGLLIATDDAPGYRTRVAMRLESASEADRKEARRLVQEILSEVDEARIDVEKKTDSAVSPAPGPVKPMPSSGRSRAKRAGRKTTSAGS